MLLLTAEEDEVQQQTINVIKQRQLEDAMTTSAESNNQQPSPNRKPSSPGNRIDVVMGIQSNGYTPTKRAGGILHLPQPATNDAGATIDTNKNSPMGKLGEAGSALN